MRWCSGRCCPQQRRRVRRCRVGTSDSGRSDLSISLAETIKVGGGEVAPPITPDPLGNTEGVCDVSRESYGSTRRPGSSPRLSPAFVSAALVGFAGDPDKWRYGRNGGRGRGGFWPAAGAPGSRRCSRRQLLRVVARRTGGYRGAGSDRGAFSGAGSYDGYFGSASVMKLFVATKLFATGQMNGASARTARKMIPQSDDGTLEALLPDVGETEVVNWAKSRYGIGDLGTTRVPGRLLGRHPHLRERHRLLLPRHDAR